MSSDPLIVANWRSHTSAIRWDAAAVVLAFVLPVLAHLDAAHSLATRWLVFDQSYGHGFGIFALSLWMSARTLRRHRFAVRPSVFGLLLTFAASAGITLAGIINVEIVQSLGLVFLLWSAVLAMAGWRAALHLAFPIGFLFFAIPFWDVLAYPLQRITAEASGLLLGLWDIRFQLKATFIHLEDIGIIEVSNGCSGQRYLIIALALAGLFSFLSLRRPSHWLYLGALAVVLALLTNWIRVFSIILVGYETVMTSPLMQEHEFLGWVLFVLLLVPLGWFGNRLVRREQEAERDTAARHRAGAGKSPTRQPVRTTTFAAYVMAFCVLVAVPPAYLMLASAQASTVDSSLSLPTHIGGWQQTPIRGGMWQPDWHGADEVLRGSYESSEANGAVTVGIWYYASQKQGKELVHYSNRIYDPQRWEMNSREVDSRGLPAVVEMINGNGAGRVALGYAFYVGGYWTDEPVLAKLLQIPATLAGRDDAALVTVSAVCEGGCEESLSRIQAFGRTLRQNSEQSGLRVLLGASPASGTSSR